ncbi:MAG: dihydrodipicolinate synthase family protein [Clostridiales bacterium]|nr:dihydrodipicolinate synthase family protein [Clostridiales bacterium]
MRDITKYQGIIPAFYACYDENGAISPEGVEELTRHLVEKGVKGVYVGGSSGECIYHSVAERKLVLEHVMKAAQGKLTVIAHVACNNTADSMELAAHAESLGVDAIASIPPIYFKLPPHAIAEYWNDISAAAPNTDFIIYNIPQLAGVALTMPLFEEMLKNKRVIGVKNSSMPTQDIEMFKMGGGEDFVVFNGPDEQLISGLAIGADGGIGGTYGVMPELYLKIFELAKQNKFEEAKKLQHTACAIIGELCACHGNLYAVMKEVLRIRENLKLGGVRKPLSNLIASDMEQVKKCAAMIDAAMIDVSNG